MRFSGRGRQTVIGAGGLVAVLALGIGVAWARADQPTERTETAATSDLTPDTVAAPATPGPAATSAEPTPTATSAPPKPGTTRSTPSRSTASRSTGTTTSSKPPAQASSCRHVGHISAGTVSRNKWKIQVDVPERFCRDEVLHYFWARYELADAGTYRLAASGRGTLDWNHRSRVVSAGSDNICSATFVVEGRGAIKQTIELGNRNVGPDYALRVYGAAQRDGWLVAESHNRESCVAQG